MNNVQQFFGGPAQGNYGFGAPLPPPVQQPGQGRNWDLLFDVVMASNARQEQALLQVGDRIGLLEDILWQAEAGEYI